MTSPRFVRYRDDDGAEREGEVVERNGNLTLVEDTETGEPVWRAPFELED